MLPAAGATTKRDTFTPTAQLFDGHACSMQCSRVHLGRPVCAGLDKINMVYIFDSFTIRYNKTTLGSGSQGGLSSIRIPRPSYSILYSNWNYGTTVQLQNFYSSPIVRSSSAIHTPALPQRVPHSAALSGAGPMSPMKSLYVCTGRERC